MALPYCKVSDVLLLLDTTLASSSIHISYAYYAYYSYASSMHRKQDLLVGSITDGSSELAHPPIFRQARIHTERA